VRRSPRLVALNQRIEDGGATKESDDTARNKRSKVVKKKKVSNPDAKKRATQRDSSDRKGEGLRPTVEEKWWKKGFGIIAGVDEAGRGPLAGPVVAAACVVPPGVWFEGVGDSKQISLQARERLFAEITGHPLVTYHIAQVSEQEIDKINIREATKVAMRNAVVGLKEYPDHVMVDGNFVPELPPEIKSSEFIIKGDTKVFSIACASILAKVFRDRIMKGYEKAYPGYGLGQNKGKSLFVESWRF